MPPPSAPSAPSAHGAPSSDALGPLVADVGRGDPTSLARLYDLTSAPVHHLALLMTGGDADLAADVVMLTYRAVWRDAGGYADDPRPLTWILGLARREGGAPAAA